MIKHTSQQSSDALVAGSDVTAASCLNCLSIFSRALLIDLRAPFHNRLSIPVRKSVSASRTAEQNNKADRACVNRLYLLRHVLNLRVEITQCRFDHALLHCPLPQMLRWAEFCTTPVLCSNCLTLFSTTSDPIIFCNLIPLQKNPDGILIDYKLFSHA